MAPAVEVEVFVCGSPDRGDDGAAMTACEAVRTELPPGVHLRAVGQLDVEDLLAVPPEATVVIVDVATGIEPGAVVELPLADLLETGTIRPRSSHALEVSGVVALAALIGQRPLHGRVVALGGTRFALGDVLSGPVAAAMPRFASAIREAIEHARSDQAVTGGAAACA
ncbi:MAG TPA: hydrogenase maturation protease [Candidatus Baltobacteraceae bacterium]|nr:hydrogenase maturation protease [Candidatus Baltobacteraceae bacterium]